MTGGKAPEVARLGSARLTAGIDRFGRLGLRDHQSVFGGIPALSSDQLIRLAKAVKLHGKGGAAFPFARKVGAVVDASEARGQRPVVLINATEGEPASWKDKMLATRVPHLILDGAMVAAGALGAREIVVGVEAGQPGEDSLAAAIAERRGSGSIRLVRMPPRFISGEGGALVRGANGQLPIPPGRKQLSAVSGVDGVPTLLSNAETYAQLAVATRLGVKRYTAVGTPDEPGTVLLTVSGTAPVRTVVETPAGVSLAEVLELCRAPVGQGVLMGGYHGKWLTPEQARGAIVSRAGMISAGAVLGAGITIPLPADTCPLGETARVAHYLAAQSAGQCGPCRLGLPDLAQILDTVVDGSGGTKALEEVRRASGMVRGRGACSHPDGTVRFIASALSVFADDVAAHALSGGCGRNTKGVLPVAADDDSELRLAVDWSRCDGHGLCAKLAPKLIRLDGNGYPVFPDSPVPNFLQAGARKAVRGCPALALRLGRRGAGKH